MSIQTSVTKPIPGDDFFNADLLIADGRIEKTGPANSLSDENAATVDLEQSIVWPTFADCHTHLDKAHAWDRSENETGDFNGALAAIERDYPFWSADDLRRRMEFGLQCSFVHGTSKVRTHLDTTVRANETAWAVFNELRQDWAGRIELQATALTLTHEFDEAQGTRLKQLMQRYDGIPGLVCYMTPDLPDRLERVFSIAMDLGTDLDFHVDETLDPGARTLEAIADTAHRLQFEGKILCGHCCSLSTQSDDNITRILDKAAAANLSIVSLPMCNLFLQDRKPGKTPRARGVTLLHEIADAGLPVAAASDNCRDGFYAYGDHDMLEVYTQTTRIAHLDRPISDWPRLVTTTPSAIMGYEDDRPLRKGAPADFILFPARKYSELLSRPQHERAVVRAGLLVDSQLPDYRELDDLIARG